MADDLAARPAALYAWAKRLKIRLVRPLRTRLSGSYASSFRGPGLDFAELRHYAPGDDVRRLDWHVTARRGLPYVRQYVEERQLRVLLAVDVSVSMAEGPPGRSKRALAALAAGALALSAAWNRDRVGAVAFAARISCIVPPRPGERHALEALRRAFASANGQAGTDLRPVLSAVRNLRGHSLVLLVSDFASSPPPCDASVRRLLASCAARHDLRAVCVSAVAPGRLPAGALVATLDCETGRRAWLDAAAGGPLSEPDRPAAEVLRACGVPAVKVHPGSDCLGAMQRLMLAARVRPGRI